MQKSKPIIRAQDSDFIRDLKRSILYLYDQIEQQPVKGDGVTFRVTQGPGGRVGHAEQREIDGSISNENGVDGTNIDNIKVDVFYDGSVTNKSSAITAPASGTTYHWIEIDLSAGTITLTSGSSLPSTSGGTLYYYLCGIDSNSKLTLYRGAWTEYTVSSGNIDLVFTMITAEAADSAEDHSLPTGTNDGDMLRWDDTAQEWVELSAPTSDGDYSLHLTITSGSASFEWDEHEAFVCS